VLQHALEALARHPRVAGITVALAPGDRRFEGLRLKLGIPLSRVAGGATRAESVLNGLRHLQAQTDADWVLVHDAARPCLPAASLHRLLDEGLRQPDGAILAIPVRDTLKREGADGRIDATVERQALWAAQTPQLFPLAALSEALAELLEAGGSPTDEAAVMEHAGRRPGLVLGSSRNLKLTWPEDLQTAEALLVAARRSEI